MLQISLEGLLGLGDQIERQIGHKFKASQSCQEDPVSGGNISFRAKCYVIYFVKHKNVGV